MNTSIGRFLKRALLTNMAIFVVVGLSACGEPVEKMATREAPAAVEVSPTTAEATVPEIIFQAEAKYAEAAALSHAWTTTRTLIEQASAALQAGNSDKARAIAEQALATAVASVEQARVEAEAWQSRAAQ
jgi:hypothetical protein